MEGRTELIVDSFADCGEASAGLEPAAGRPVDIAINRARQAHAKLDRSQWKGCEYCTGDLEGYTSQFRDVNGRSRNIYVPEGEAAIVIPGKYNHKFCIPIGYYPHCSRPLTEEAWAELERKISNEP